MGGHRLGKFQVRKRDGRWEVWTFTGTSWERHSTYWTWTLAMMLATGQMPYGDKFGDYRRVLRLIWVPSQG